ncbi:hypothetical protein H6758_01470 [Candidatus Nomurabacteria bacterium]|nr:hypothetical protein [Candidatus Nomurabacteria bacterium]
MKSIVYGTWVAEDGKWSCNCPAGTKPPKAKVHRHDVDRCNECQSSRPEKQFGIWLDYYAWKCACDLPRADQARWCPDCVRFRPAPNGTDAEGNPRPPLTMEEALRPV